MASLTGQSVASSYEQLLHVDRDGGGNTTTLVDIKDGDNGTTFALQLATDKINVNGAINSTINTTGVIGGLRNTHASGYGLKIQATDASSARYITTFNDKDDNVKAQIKGDGSATFAGNVDIGARVGTGLLEVKDSVDNDYAGRFENTHSGGYGGLFKVAGTTSGEIVFQARAASNNILTVLGDGVIELGSGQLKFPDSQNASSDANTLDDYEEGAFTPTISFDGGSGTVTYNVQSGQYTKIGNRVFGAFDVRTVSIASRTGNVRLSGLPFSSGSSTLEVYLLCTQLV